MAIPMVIVVNHSGGATPGRAKSNNMAGRSIALATPCLLLCFGNNVKRNKKMLPYLTALFVYFESETISGVGGLCSEGDD